MKKSIVPPCQANQIQIRYVPRRHKTYILRTRATYDYLMQIWDKDLIHLQCQYVAVFLDKDHIVMGWRCITTNTYENRRLDTGLVFAIAATIRAEYIVIAHNNPHGNLVDTQRDHKLYKKLLKLCRHLGCHLQDQMIISPQGYYSFAENNGVYL